MQYFFKNLICFVVTGHCPSGDDPFTTFDEEDCFGLTQYPGGKSLLFTLHIIFISFILWKYSGISSWNAWK